MTLSTFPDVNVWLALLLENHVHRAAARRWLVYRVRPDRLSAGNQMSVLRLLTTSAAMNGRPLRMTEAWAAYDSLFGNTRARITLLLSCGRTPGCWLSPNAPMPWSLRSTRRWPLAPSIQFC
jgi:predicted nucleic acid-binding protein